MGSASAGPLPPTSPVATRAADAVVFVPGVSPAAKQSPDLIASKLAVAFDRQSPAQNSYIVKEGKNEKIGPDASVPVRSIVEVVNGVERPVLDLYHLGYRDELTGRFAKRPLIAQILTLLFVLIGSVPLYVRALRATAKDGWHKLQMAWGTLVLGSIAVYTGVLIYGLVIGILTLLPGHTGASGLSSYFGWVDAKIVGVILVVSGLGTLTKNSIKELLQRTAIDYVSLINYVRVGERRQALVGHVLSVLDLVEGSGPGRRVHVVAFSFGSLVALDTVFSHNPPGARTKDIATLVTIGCPFDLVRSYWPRYFDGRHGWPDSPRVWLNVYSPRDVLASNFRDDSKLEAANTALAVAERPGVPPRPENIVFESGNPTLGVLDILYLEGLKAHAAYWDADDPLEESAFDLFASRLRS
jgi:hypothetical protein